MLTFILFFCAQPVAPPAVAFDRLTLSDAAALNGAEVAITFTVGRPVYTWPRPLRTVCGPDEIDDQERTAVLRGQRMTELREGMRVRAVGVVRVIHHEAAVVNGVVVPKWDEIRFDER